MLIVFSFGILPLFNAYAVNESTNESALTKPSAETEVAQAPKANNGIDGVGGGGKGIGMFAKKRSATVAPSKVTTSINAYANVTGAHGQKFSPIRNTNAVMNNNSAIAAVENSSVANLSRFDTDLMSKNTENAAVADDSCVNVGGGNDGNEKYTEEVPKSIPTSGDDVEDDLTEATAATFAMDVGGGWRLMMLLPTKSHLQRPKERVLTFPTTP